MTRFTEQLRRARAELVAPCARPVLVVGEIPDAPPGAHRVDSGDLRSLAASGRRFATILTSDALSSGMGSSGGASSGGGPARVAQALLELLEPEGTIRFVERDRGRGPLRRVGAWLRGVRVDVTGTLWDAGATVVVCTRPRGPRGLAHACGVARHRRTAHTSRTGREPAEETT